MLSRRRTPAKRPIIRDDVSAMLFDASAFGHQTVDNQSHLMYNVNADIYDIL